MITLTLEQQQQIFEEKQQMMREASGVLPCISSQTDDYIPVIYLQRPLKCVDLLTGDDMFSESSGVPLEIAFREWVGVVNQTRTGNDILKPF